VHNDDHVHMESPNSTEGTVVGLILVLLLLALIFGGLGFVFPLLWIVALVLFIGWVLGLSRHRSHARA
jgi:hypothetical protein